jgi:hypothetical protein
MTTTTSIAVLTGAAVTVVVEEIGGIVLVETRMQRDLGPTLNETSRRFAHRVKARH